MHRRLHDGWQLLRGGLDVADWYTVSGRSIWVDGAANVAHVHWPVPTGLLLPRGLDERHVAPMPYRLLLPCCRSSPDAVLRHAQVQRARVSRGASLAACNVVFIVSNDVGICFA